MNGRSIQGEESGETWYSKAVSPKICRDPSRRGRAE